MSDAQYKAKRADQCKLSGEMTDNKSMSNHTKLHNDIVFHMPTVNSFRGRINTTYTSNPGWYNKTNK